MTRQRQGLAYLSQIVLITAFLLGGFGAALAGSPHSAYYSSETDKVMWFVHASDLHIGTSGSTDTTNLTWLVGTARSVLQPSFFLVTGDLTDSTNGNLFGYPNGPYQAEWDAYKAVTASVDAGIFYDLPGNHDAYNDQYFSYYLANSVQGRATGKTQASWTRTGAWGKYHFLGVNTADNTGASFSILPPYGDYAGLDSAELGFISDQLAVHADAGLTMIFGHHPLVPTGSSTDTYLYYGKDAFVQLMDTRGASLYGYGHTHDSSERFFTQNMGEGVFYMNVAALGKDSPNDYTITAIDCNAVSTVTQPVGTWPVVLITVPMDRYLGVVGNPYAYTVANSAQNPIRALVFDPGPVTQVQFSVNGAALKPMTAVAGNPHLWQGIWDASALSQGEYTITVVATTNSGMRSDTVATYVNSQAVPKVGVTGLVTGKYVTSGKGSSRTTVFSPTASFKPGETVTIRATVKDASGVAVPNATVQLAVRGPSSTTLTSGLSNVSGIAEAKWTTTAPNKRGQGGTPVGSYTVTVTGVIAAGSVWDGTATSASLTLQ